MTFRSRGWQRFGRVVSGLFFLVSVGYVARPFFASSGSDAAVGQALPAGTLSYVRNGTGSLRLDQLAGKPALISFWEPWCGYCVDEMPLIARLHERWAPKGVVVMSVSGENLGDTRDFLARPSMQASPVPFAFDAGGRVARALGVRKLPFAVFIGRDGKVAATKAGVLSESDTDEQLQALLGP